MTKPTNWPVRPAKTQISLSICSVGSESSQCAQWAAEAFFMRTVKTLIRQGGCQGWSESSLGSHAILLVLSWGGSNSEKMILAHGLQHFSFGTKYITKPKYPAKIMFWPSQDTEDTYCLLFYDANYCCRVIKPYYIFTYNSLGIINSYIYGRQCNKTDMHTSFRSAVWPLVICLLCVMCRLVRCNVLHMQNY